MRPLSKYRPFANGHSRRRHARHASAKPRGWREQPRSPCGAVKDYTSNYEATLSEDVQEGRILLLPPNLYIWATMNTSDQSLFPIDSAFKRRWDWVYIPISASDEDNFGIKVGKHFYDWGKFISRMNLVVADVTSSEDKQLGYYFCKADEGGNIISANRFVNKVLFYLWNDVFKNYGFEAKLDGKDVFKYKNDEGKDDTMSFTSFYISNGLPNVKQIKRLMDNLGLEGFNEWPAEKAEENTNDGTAKLLSVTYNDNVVDGASNKEIFVKTLELIIKDRDADEVAKVIGIEMTKNPPSQSETTRDYKKVGDSDCSPWLFDRVTKLKMHGFDALKGGNFINIIREAQLAHASADAHAEERQALPLAVLRTLRPAQCKRAYLINIVNSDVCIHCVLRF